MEQMLQPGRSVRTLGWTVICFLVLPILVIFPVSVTDQRFLSMPQQGISLQHYANLFTSPEWLSSIGQSSHFCGASTNFF